MEWWSIHTSSTETEKRQPDRSMRGIQLSGGEAFSGCLGYLPVGSASTAGQQTTVSYHKRGNLSTVKYHNRGNRTTYCASGCQPGAADLSTLLRCLIHRSTITNPTSAMAIASHNTASGIIGTIVIANSPHAGNIAGWQAQGPASKWQHTSLARLPSCDASPRTTAGYAAYSRDSNVKKSGYLS